ncbi:MAG: hypothetical protein HPY52_15915 [Firmicutes bacterium]|nr:hypothetical protein [Bacillota bacterium]
MLEDCQNISQCEETIAGILENSGGSGYQLLGELPVSRQDIDLLDRLVSEHVRPDAASVYAYGDAAPGYVDRGVASFRDMLSRQFPVSLALFLVWQGLRGYQEGDFWTAVHNATGERDRHCETDWGEAFLSVVGRFSLTGLDDTHSFKYVTPILLHGGIPESCLPEYFQNIAWSVFVAKGITEDSSILKKLEELRACWEGAGNIQTEIDRLSRLIDQRKRDIKRLDEYIHLQARMAALQPLLETLSTALDLQKQIKNLATKRAGLMEQLVEAKNRQEAYSTGDEAILARRESHAPPQSAKAIIEKCSGESQDSKPALTAMEKRFEELQEQGSAVANRLRDAGKALFETDWREEFSFALASWTPDIATARIKGWREAIEVLQKSQRRTRPWRAFLSLMGAFAAAAGAILIISWPGELLWPSGASLPGWLSWLGKLPKGSATAAHYSGVPLIIVGAFYWRERFCMGGR